MKKVENGFVVKAEKEEVADTVQLSEQAIGAILFALTKVMADIGQDKPEDEIKSVDELLSEYRFLIADDGLLYVENPVSLSFDKSMFKGEDEEDDNEEGDLEVN